jgi:hypothetical protein
MKHSILLSAFIALTAASAALVAGTSTAGPVQEKEKKLEFPQASPAATVKQRVGVTDVAIEYSRPSVKGRKIFGGLVPFDTLWRTGANTATKLSFGTEVKFGGKPVPAGDYALFTIPGASEWTVILSKVTGQWGSYSYDQKDDQARITVKPAALNDMVETLTIGINDVRDGSATLAIDWEKTRIAVKIDIDIVAMLQPQIKAAMAAEGKKPYFPAAMFYYENDLDLKQAATWIDEAIKEQPDAPWIVYRKGLILNKLGDKAGALAAAQQALELAKKKGGSVGKEYTTLSEALIAKLK